MVIRNGDTKNGRANISACPQQENHVYDKRRKIYRISVQIHGHTNLLHRKQPDDARDDEIRTRTGVMVSCNVNSRARRRALSRSSSGVLGRSEGRNLDGWGVEICARPRQSYTAYTASAWRNFDTAERPSTSRDASRGKKYRRALLTVRPGLPCPLPPALFATARTGDGCRMMNKCFVEINNARVRFFGFRTRGKRLRAEQRRE